MAKSEHARRMRYFSRLVATAVAGAAIFASGCSGGVDGGKGRESAAKGEGSEGTSRAQKKYSLKVYLKSAAGEYELRELTREGTLPDTISEPEGSDVRAKEQEIKVDFGTGEPVDYPRYGAPGSIYDLMGFTAEHCVSEYEAELEGLPETEFGAPEAVPGGGAYLPHSSQGTFASKWLPGEGTLGKSWYVINVAQEANNEYVNSCDDVLFLQSQLICVASKLEEMATAVAPVRLHQRFGGSDVIVPPQSPADRFLLRYLEFETLASFGPLGEARVGVGDQGEPGTAKCGPLLGSMAVSPNLYTDAEWHDELFDTGGRVPFLGFDRVEIGDYPLTTAELEDLTRPRLQLWVEHHRAAQQLLALGLDGAAEGWLGQAEELRYEGGLEAMWGLGDKNLDVVPNSLRGALAGLLGRLEIDIRPVRGVYNGYPGQLNDPQCSNIPRLRDVSEERDILTYVGGVFEARAADAPPETLEQQRAAALTERLGLVIPPDEVKEHAGAGALVSMVREQLAIDDAANSLLIAHAEDASWTLPSYDESDSSNELTQEVERLKLEREFAYDTQFDGLKDEDFAHALLGTYSVFIQLSQLSWESMMPSEEYAGLYRLTGYEASQLQAWSGQVVSSAKGRGGGLSRALLSGDVFARFAPAMVASQCQHNEEGTSDVAKNHSYQSVASAAFSISNNMGLNRQTFDAELTESIEAAHAEYASLHSVDGFFKFSLAGGGDGDWTIRADYSPDLLPGPEGVPVRELVEVMYGYPWEADCLAGQRTVCPEDFDPHVFEFDASLAGRTTRPHWQAWRVTEDPTKDSVPTYSEGQSPAAIVQSGKFLFVVRKPLEDEPGRVLVAAKPTTGDIHAYLSRTRRSWLNQVFSVSGARNPGDKCIERTGTSIPEMSCLPGIYRDQYVPVSNELTSSAESERDDSWKHYLALAEESAQLADSLGTEMLQLGERRDLRKEGSQEALAALCGVHGDADQISSVNGRVSSGTDSQLNSCMSPEQVDIVFFGEFEEDPDAYLTNLASSPFCSGNSSNYCTPSNYADECEEDDEDCFTAAGLNLETPGLVRDVEYAPGCDRVLGTEGRNYTEHFINSGTFLNKEYGQAILTEAFADARMATALYGFNYYDHASGAWSLWLGGEVVLAGKVHDLTVEDAEEEDLAEAFPYCLEVDSSGAGCNARAVEVMKVLGMPAQTPNSQSRRLRRMVQSGLWHMAILTGYLPEGTFTKQVPVANFLPGGDGTPVPMYTHFGRSKFQTVTTDEKGDYIVLLGNTQTYSEDKDVMSVLRRPTPGLIAGGVASFGMFDWSSTWYGESPGVEYLVREASNNVRLFPQVRVGDYLEQGGTPGPQGWLYAVVAGGSMKGYPSKQNLIESEGCSGGGPGTRCFLDVDTLGNVKTSVLFSEDDVNGGLMPTVKDRVWANTLKEVFRGNKPVGQDLIDVAYNYHPLRVPGVEDGSYEGTTLYFFPRVSHLVGGPGPKGDIATIVPDIGLTGSYGLSSSGQWPTDDVFHLFNYFQGSYSDIVAGECFSSASGDVDCSGAVAGSTSVSVATANYYNVAANVLSPSWWPPESRVHHYIHPGDSPEEALVAVGMLTCLGAGGAEPESIGQVPVIRSAEQVPALRRWIQLQAERIAEDQESMFVPGVPSNVVDYFGSIGLGRTELHSAVGSGETGEYTYQLAHAFESAHRAAGDIASGFRQMASAIESAELGLAAANIAKESELNSLAMARVNASGELAGNLLQAASGALQFFGGAISGNAGAVLGSVTSIAQSAIGATTANSAINLLADKEELLKAGFANNAATTLQQMGEEVSSARDFVADAVSRMRTAQVDALRALNQLERIAGSAQYEAAKAAGADYFVNSNGEQVPLPVNTVYRRTYDVTKLRYKRALQSAKRYAYLARLSIEQKLGVRMESLVEELGPLPSPSTWASSLCGFVGLDYEALRKAGTGVLDPDEPGGEAAVVENFAGRYIGDYIRELREFVEYYNLSYPFHEEDDAAVLSLRDDLLYGDAKCFRESPNLLLFSHELYRGGPEVELLEDTGTIFDPSTATSIGGWSPTLCGVSGGDNRICLAVQGATYISPGNDGQFWQPGDEETDDETVELLSPLADVASGTEAGGVSLLLLRSATAEEEQVVYGGTPTASVYQTVWLSAGDLYSLSWWDMSRNQAGGPSDEDQGLRVMVANESWDPVTLEEFVAPGSGDDAGWSERREMQFAVPRDGHYHLSFAPNTQQGPGGLAVSNVQLAVTRSERLADYFPTSGTREGVATNCMSGDPKLFRDAFERSCEGEVCFYELTKPIQITSSGLSEGTLELPGIAAGNYNYRHGRVALNVVGTGVVDCEGQNAGCFANGFLEYDLVHTAHNAGLTDYAGETRCFNFGEGAINHGKALAAERFFGVPLGSADKGLVVGNEFSKATLRGRPLTGSYKLRIYDSPTLRWENLEDLQLVLDYRYWSRVKAN